MRTNKRVGALLRRGDEILLIHRFRDGSEYWVLPGGGVEGEETLEEALLREVLEETSLAVSEFKLLGEHDREDGGKHIFYEIVADGDPVLGGPEKDGMDENNVYILEWVNKDVAKAMDSFYPVEIKEYF
jgi:8-oxo-dGTP diphosphatase